MFICYEMAKGPESFFAPYFDILPHPGSILDWNQEELNELQNEFVGGTVVMLLC